MFSKTIKKTIYLTVSAMVALFFLFNLLPIVKPVYMYALANGLIPSSYPPSQWRSSPAWTKDGKYIAVSYPLRTDSTTVKKTTSKRGADVEVYELLGPRSKTYILDAKSFAMMPFPVPEALYAPMWSPNGRFLIGMPPFGSLLSFDRLDKKTYQTTEFRGFRLPLVFAPDSSAVAIAGIDRVQIRTPNLQKVIATLTSDSQLYVSIDWSPDGKQIAVSSGRSDEQVTDSYFAIFDVLSTKPILEKFSKEGFGKVGWSKTGNYFAFGNKDISVLDAATLKEVATLKTNDLPSDVQFAWSNNGDKLAYKGEDRKLHVLDIATQKELLSIVAEKTGRYQYKWSPKDNYLNISSEDFCTVCDAITGQCVLVKPTHEYVVTSWFPDETSLAIEKLEVPRDDLPPVIECLNIRDNLRALAIKDKQAQNPWLNQKVPLTLEDCLNEMPQIMDAKTRQEFKEMPEDELWHVTDTFISMPIRNKFGLRQKTPLVDYFNKLGLKDGWSMSTLIVETYWRKLNNRPLEIEKLAAGLKDSEQRREAKLLKNSTSSSK